MDFTIGDAVKIIVDNDPEYYENESEQDPFDGSSYLYYGMTVLVNDIVTDNFLNVEVEWVDDEGNTRIYWVNDSILKKKSYGPPRKSTGNKILDKSLELEAKFKERKKNASNLPLQNGIGKCKKPLPFPKATVTFSEESPF